MEDKRVALVVDDDPDIALVCTLQLERAGFAVLEAGSGQQALDLARDQRPSVILLDHMLPDFDGVEVMRQLRDRPETRDIPVVMLTARTHTRDRQAAWGAGVRDYLTKPFEGEALVRAVRGAAGLGDEAGTAVPGQPRARSPRRPAPDTPGDGGWLARAVEGASDAIICKTLDGEITYWNRGAEQLYGWHATEAVGQHISLLTSVETKDEIPGILARVRRGETVRVDDTARLHRDGHRLHVSLCVSPILDEAGEVVGASAIARDVSARVVADGETAQVEAQLRASLEAAPDAIVVIDAAGVITLVNRRTEQVFGHSREDLVGRRADVLMTADALAAVPRLRAAARRATKQGPADPPAPQEVLLRRRDDSVFTAEVGVSTYETGRGVVTVASVRDVSQRRRSDERFRAVVEAAPDAMVIVAGDGTIELVNAQMVRLFGYERDELVGQKVEMLVPQRFRARHVSHRHGFLDQASVRPMGAGQELAGLRKDSSEFAVEISLSPLDEGAGSRATCATIRDVTERRLIEEAKELAAEREREASARLREIDRMRSDFLSTVSHELRTPLTAIKGFSEWLTGSWDQTPDVRKREMLRRIHHAAGRLDLLVQDLLDSSRLERGRLRVDLEPTSLRVVVDEAVQLASGELDAHAVVREVDSVLVLADRTALLRVLENLLTNAAKFSERGAPIEVTTETFEDHVVLSVRDHGVGIPAAEHGRIFDRFYRVASTAQATPGTGIGLAIVKQFTEAQGGSVSVDTPADGGTEFRLRLRRASS
jgi:protein-histidine pros-kinase